MAKFRKKPVVIEAVQFQNRIDCPPWLGEAIQKQAEEVGGVFRIGDELHIFTLEGTMVAQFGDWIVRGVKGELYPCKPDIFAATYEAVDQ